MSIKDRLTKKTAGIVQAALDSAPLLDKVAHAEAATGSQQRSESRVPRTGPGQMLAFRTHMQENTARVQELEDRLKIFDGSLPVRKLDPSVVLPSRWANRHASSFENSEFSKLKTEIEAAGGNIQPILVRPMPKKGAEQFEIVFGHRRHQACLQLGLSVLAVIEDVSDRDLFSAMDRENRARADLSPYEQGEMYRRALDDGLFPSLRALAAEVNADPGNLSKAISIARLPADVLGAFHSPTDIQFRWGSVLQKQLEKEPDAVLARAKLLINSHNKSTPVQIFEALTGQARGSLASTIELRKSGKSLGRMKRASDGSVVISLKPGVLNDEAFLRLQDAVEKLVIQ